ncbi:MAG TPA: DUF3179 domain-containing protein [Thermohalobaculum sp.]|nr:DUF3179 domain-containing protein [Thermohalobaculum sp.]
MLPRLLAALLLLAPFAPFTPFAAFGGEVPSGWERAWPNTDFSRITVDPAEILSGGPPRDGIPAITGPEMLLAAQEHRLDPREPVMVYEPPDTASGEPARAYPVRYLMWHEIVNDEVAGVPVAVTFCPLCNSGLVFDRRVDGEVLEFGVSGMLRHSDMIMYDRQTESWWQQFTGEAIVGELVGVALTPLPALLESWQSFRARHQEGMVMNQPDGHRRAYGNNPYTGYDSGRPFLYRGEPPPHGIDPVARVVRVGDRAWPLERLREAGEIVEAGYRLSWAEGQASALDTGNIGEGREVGDVRVVDAASGAPVVHEVFAFAFHAFEPDRAWMLGE